MKKPKKRSLSPGGYKKNQSRIADQKDTILHWMARGKSLAFGCAKADISYTQAKKWQEDDEPFAIACSDAYEVGTQGLEDIADNRAKRRSDVLLMFLMKGRDAKYRDSAKVVVEIPAPRVNARKF